MRWHPQAQAAILENKVAAFYLTSSRNLSGQMMAEAFVAALPRIVRFLNRYQPPFLAKVGSDGSVREWLPAGDVLRRQRRRAPRQSMSG